MQVDQPARELHLHRVLNGAQDTSGPLARYRCPMVPTGWWNVPGWPFPEEWAALWGFGAMVVGLGTMIATFGTLAAAVVAGVYAARAARATREQANAAAEDVGLARRALEIAEADAIAARSEAERATRWGEERRLDGLAPSMFMEAFPYSGNATGAFFTERYLEGGAWAIVDEGATFDAEDARNLKFRQSLKIRLRNLSTVPARVDFVDPSNGHFYLNGVLLVGGGPVWVTPDDDSGVWVEWFRTLPLRDLLEDGDAPVPGTLFQVEVWVRDAGMNVSDLYTFSGRITTVKREGFDISLLPVPPGDWLDRVAYPVRREYTRLSADASQ